MADELPEFGEPVEDGGASDAVRQAESDAAAASAAAAAGAVDDGGGGDDENRAFLNRWREKFDVELEYDSDDELFEDLQGIHESQWQLEERRRELSQFEQQVKEYQENKEALEALKAGRPAATSPESAVIADAADAASGVSDFDLPEKAPAMSPTTQLLVNRGVITVNPKTGLYTSEDSAASEYVKNANEVKNYREQLGQRFAQDPLSTLDHLGLRKRFETLEEKLMREMDERLSKRLEEETATRSLSAADNSDLYEVRDGRPVIDRDGVQKLTPRGQVFYQSIADAEALMGVKFKEASPKQKLQIQTFARQKADLVDLGQTTVADETETEEEAETQPTSAQKRKARQAAATSSAGKNRLKNLPSNGTSVAELAAHVDAGEPRHLEDLWEQGITG